MSPRIPEPPRSSATTRKAATLLLDHATVFAALGDGTRLRLVQRLSDGGSLSIRALATDEPHSRQAISKHLAVLAEAGLVRGERHGREQRYVLDVDRLLEARRHLERISSQWDVALGRLKDLVEGT